MTGSAQLPIIDLSLFDIGAPWRDQVAAQVDSAASAIGTFQLVGHGVDVSLIEAALDLGGKYVNPARGHDRREDNSPLKPSSVPDLPGFHDTVREYATTLTGLGHKLLALMARGLNLDDGYFADHYTGNPSTSLRIGEFPVALSAGGRPDTDESGNRRLLSLLKVGDSERLQLKIDDEWTDVHVLPNALLCSVGPALGYLTHGQYRHVSHRLGRGFLNDRPSLRFSFEPGIGVALTPLEVLRPRVNLEATGTYALSARC
jgi:isopenicillin N synthase-like dioxygenase